MRLIGASRAVIVLVLGLSIFFSSQLKHLRFDYELERFFPLHHESTEFFDRFKKTFGSDSDYLLIGLHNDKGIFHKPFLLKADSLYRALNELALVEFIHAPTRIREQKRNRFSSVPIETPWLHFLEESRYAADSARIYQSEWANYLFAQDRQSIMLYVQHKDQITAEECEQLADTVKAISLGIGFEEVHFAGRCFGQTAFIRLIRQETAVFVGISLFLVVVFLWISYRRFWGIWMPLTIVALSILWTLGLMSLMGRPLDIISNIIPTLLLIIGIADVVHLLTHYLKLRKLGEDKWTAVKNAARIVGKATLLTTLTTALGFLSLTTSSFVSLIELGVFATVGILIAFLLTYTLLPALIFLHPPLYRPGRSFSGFWEKVLAPCFEWTLKHQNSIIAGSVLIIVIGVFGATQIKVDNYLLADLNEDHPLQKDQRFFSGKFGGPRTFECMVEVRDSAQTVFSPEILEELAQVETYLKENYKISNLIGPASMIASANKSYHFGGETYDRIPDSTALIQPLVRRLEQYSERYELQRFITEDHRQARIRGQIPDWGSYVLNAKNEDFYRFLTSDLPGRKLHYRITGTPHLMDLNAGFLASNVLTGLLIALVIIAMIFAWLFRSVKVVLITLVPNLLPLLFVAGLMGFSGIDLKISTSIIFIIAFGIAVDDSIHFLSRFRKELSRQPVLDAVRVTYLTTGKAIVVTSLILLGGFLSFCFSAFEGTFYIGVLVSSTLLVALVADLTILPVLLVRVLGQEEREVLGTDDR